MEKIKSFTINHLKLKPGIYLSRRDEFQSSIVTTFDLRFTAPYKDKPMDSSSMHTIEHLGATFLRNSEYKDRIIYFGPMGCKTGFYLVMFGEITPLEIKPIIISLCDYILSFKGRIPGARKKECGNYLFQNLPLSKIYIKEYRDELINNFRYKYDN